MSRVDPLSIDRWDGTLTARGPQNAMPAKKTKKTSGSCRRRLAARALAAIDREWFPRDGNSLSGNGFGLAARRGVQSCLEMAHSGSGSIPVHRTAQVLRLSPQSRNSCIDRRLVGTRTTWHSRHRGLGCARGKIAHRLTDAPSLAGTWATVRFDRTYGA
jgi:hypothetical protein